MQAETNWIPRPFQTAADRLAKDAVRRFIKDGNQVVGRESGPIAAAIVREMAHICGKERLECIPTSFQIKLEAECGGLRLDDYSQISNIDVIFDGADEIDSHFMIKGGGGALLREKIVHSASRKSSDCC